MLTWAEVHYLSGLIGGQMGGMSDEDFGAAERRGEVERKTPMGLANIVHLDAHGQRIVTPMRWGWPKRDMQDGRRDLGHMHARSETIDTLPTFRDAFATRRGILFVSTFNEGEELPNGKTKQWVCWDPARRPLALAVLYQVFAGGDGGAFPAFVQATVEPCPALRAHNVTRMVAIVEPGHVPMWLGETDEPLAHVKTALKTYEGALTVQEQDPPRPMRRPPRPPSGSRETPRLF